MAEDLVGKDLLEQLMFSLYPDAETIYREYLQNACDSINEAVDLGILSNKGDGHVTIKIDKFHHIITIEDNGTGIKADEAELTLKSIARSNKKTKSSFAGFMGIGRLVGGGYCKELIFETSYIGENVASKLVFDMDLIREYLNDNNDKSSASDVIHCVTTFQKDILEDINAHYFKVTLKDVLPKHHHVLLDEEKIYEYLLQVAPIPYEASFYNNLIKPNLTNADNKYSDYYNQLNVVKVSLNDFVNIEKPYELKFKGTEYEYIDEDGQGRKENITIDDIRFFSISDPQLGDLAWGWYAYNPLGRQISDIDPFTNKKVLTRGIRLRCHNILIGNEVLLNDYFKETRGNTYFNGEIFILNNDIIPTTDRSNLAPTDVFLKFKDKLEYFCQDELHKLYYAANKANSQIKKIKNADEEIRKIVENTEMPEESKAKKIAEKQAEKQKAEEQLKKVTDRSNDEKQSAAMRGLAEKFKKQIDDYQNNSTQSTTIPPHLQTPKSKTMEDKINELADFGYKENEISLIKKIFNIIDKRYMVKHQAVVKTIKDAIIKDLAK